MGEPRRHRPFDVAALADSPSADPPHRGTHPDPLALRETARARDSRAAHDAPPANVRSKRARFIATISSTRRSTG